MIDTQSPAFIAACEAFNAAPQCPELGAEIALAEAIAAWEAARPKLPTITGLPTELHGKRVIGWAAAIPSAGDWYYSVLMQEFRRAWSSDTNSHVLIPLTEVHDE